MRQYNRSNGRIVRSLVFKLVVLSLGVFLFTTAARAQSGLALLKVEPGASVNALAGAAVALRNDISAVGANPALAGLNAQPGVSFGYNSYWPSISLTDFTLAPRLSSRFAGILAMQYAGVDGIEQRSSATSTPLATFGLNDVSLRVGASGKVVDKLFAGVSAGWVYEKIDIWRGSSLSFDFGAAFLMSESVVLGLSVTHLGSSFALAAPNQEPSREITQPTAIRGGVSYERNKLLASGEIEHSDGSTVAKLGAGYSLIPEFALRAGYRIGDDSRTFSAGLVASKDQFQLSYTVVPYRHSLGTAHLISLGIHW